MILKSRSQIEGEGVVTIADSNGELDECSWGRAVRGEVVHSKGQLD